MIYPLLYPRFLKKKINSKGKCRQTRNELYLTRTKSASNNPLPFWRCRWFIHLSNPPILFYSFPNSFIFSFIIFVLIKTISHPHSHSYHQDPPCGHGGVTAAPGASIGSVEQDLRGLFPEEPTMGIGVVRSFHVPRVLRQAPRTRRPHLLRPIRNHGFLVRTADQENGGRW